MSEETREERRREEERPVREAGGGEAEGFEQAEEALVEAAQHGDESNPLDDAYEVSPEIERTADAGEADELESSERDYEDR